MAAFTLDTSGVVMVPHDSDANSDASLYRWTDLTPFQQGYVEALFASNDPMRWESTGSPAHTVKPAFDRLSPEALSLILRDCEAFQATEAFRHWVGDWVGKSGLPEPQDVGRDFWRYRTNRDLTPDRHNYGGYLGQRIAEASRTFPPLTVTLSDKGKVELAVAA